MKKLLLVRHGKAEDDSPNGDFGRELKPKGVREVEDLARQLDQEKLTPEVIITSDAARAKATATIISKYLAVENVINNHAIYEAEDSSLLQIVNSIENKYEFAMLTGHNPGFSSVATYSSGKYVNLRTAGAVVLEFDVDNWKEISGGTGLIAWQREA